LVAHHAEAAIQRLFIVFMAHSEEAIERGFNQRRFRDAGALNRNRDRQPSGQVLGEIDANSGFHHCLVMTRGERLLILHIEEIRDGDRPATLSMPTIGRSG
jgi:hypothetical protein